MTAKPSSSRPLGAATVPDAAPGNWVDRLAPATWLPYLRLARFDRPIGAWLLLFPCWWGQALGELSIGRPYPNLWYLALFLVGAFVILYGFPRHTARLFAWPIKPTMTSMMLASAYLGGAYFFVRVVAERHWSVIKGGFLPVVLFASLLGVATVIHWGVFNHGHVTFGIWATLYFTTPGVRGVAG